MWPLFPRVFSFRLGDRRLFYQPRTGSITERGTAAGDCEIAIPPLMVKEALRNDHLTDLGITMAVRIRLSRAIDPIKWQVEELVLVLSHVGETRHDIVSRWDLAPELPLFQ